MGCKVLKCTRCKAEKPSTLEFFPSHNRKKNGFDSWCRECRNEYKKEFRVPDGIHPDELERAYEAKKEVKNYDRYTFLGERCSERC